MSAPLYIPSSTTTATLAPPTSTTTKTSSYTIPVGKYAIVKPSSIKCTINGVESFLSSPKTFTTTIAFTGSVAQANHYIASGNFEGKITTGAQNTAKGIALLSNFYSVNSTTFSVNRFIVSRVTGTTPVSVYYEKNMFSGTGLQNNYLLSDGTGTTYSSYIIGQPTIYGFQELNTSLTWNVFSACFLNPVTIPSGTVISGADWLVEEYTI